MADELIAVKPEIAAHARVDAARYRAMYDAAARDADGFWRKEAGRIAWMQPPTIIKNVDFTGDVSIKWFEDGALNASVSCLDRHIEAGHGDRGNVRQHLAVRAGQCQVCFLVMVQPAAGIDIGRHFGLVSGRLHPLYLPRRIAPV